MEESKIIVNERKLVIPGDVLATGLDFLPSSGCYRENNTIKAKVLGLAKIKDRFVGIVPLSGVFVPRPGDGIIGFIQDLLSTSWIVDINSPYDAIMPLGEAVGEFVDITKRDISTYFDIGDIIYAKILNVTKSKHVQITMNDYRAKKLSDGRLLIITPSKVPRLIGKQGSMIELIKKETKCQIIVGQNGVVWIKGEREGLASKAIKMIEQESHISGLTEKITELLGKGE
ncbi:MAG: exosome complex protein Rrp4 [Nanoarchaeota archaeon]|nr:exosome complex protein Rrp4 [Nanoarchaeota archaeon]MBU4124517.1 exosome complex protein Rrp4 [Nanoarchaeota archaeon]